MKKIILFLAVAILSINGFAQKKPAPKPSTPAKTSGMTLADANKLIMYINSVQGFFSEQYANLKPVENAYTEFEQKMSKYGKQENVANDNFQNTISYNETLNNFIANEVKAKNTALDPTNAPACAGADNQAFMKTKFQEFGKLYDACREQNKVTLTYFDNPAESNDAAKKKRAEAELAKFEDLGKQIFKVQDDILEKLYELGMKAEAVTLAKHPFKTEFMDMKKILHSTEKMDRFTQLSTEEITAQLPKLDEIMSNEIQPINTTYANYQTFRKGEDPRTDELRTHIKDFFQVSAELPKAVKTFKEKYNSDKAWEKQQAQNAIKSVLKRMGEKFNAVVNSNNR